MKNRAFYPDFIYNQQDTGGEEMKKKGLIFIALVLVLTVGMIGFASAGTLTDIVKRGELRVAVQSGAAPYAFVDKNGKHTGSMVEFAREMAKRMGVKLKILDFDWDGLIPALLSGKADILAADMTPTLKRALKITFCDPWYYVQPCIFTKTEAKFKTLQKYPSFLSVQSEKQV
jgi:polar amino acid transport system substrate-binding protein